MDTLSMEQFLALDDCPKVPKCKESCIISHKIYKLRDINFGHEKYEKYIVGCSHSQS